MVAQAQHYVPQFYLRAFAKKRRRSYYLVCYDKPSRRQFVSNVINIAQQTRFYDIPDDPVYGSGAEDFLRKGEPGWAQAIHTILTSPSTVRRPSVKDPLSEFAASLMSRTPSLRTEIAHIGEAASKRLLQHGVSLPQVSPDDLKRHQASLLVKQTPVYASILREMAWVVVTNNTGAAFWTSDNPLVKYNPRVDELRGNLGLLSTGIQLYLPLSPKLTVGFIDPEDYGALPTLIEADEQVVQFCNSQQLVWSLSYLFSRQNDFALADEFLESHPMFADPDRPRVVAS